MNQPSLVWEDLDKTTWEQNDPRWFSPADRVLFIHSLSVNGGNVEKALTSIDWRVSPVIALRAYKSDVEFRASWDEAVEASTLMLESSMVERGRGIRESVFDKDGNVSGEKTTFSDSLLTLALKSRKPNAYRENVKAEVSGPNGAPLDSTGYIDKIIELIEKAKK